MVARTWNELLMEELKLLRHASDDLWEFAQGILVLTDVKRGGSRAFDDIRIRRGPAPDRSYPYHEVMLRGEEASVRVVLTVGRGAHRMVHRLGLFDLERCLTSRDEKDAAKRCVYDMFDDLWRHLGGQEVENPPTVALA